MAGRAQAAAALAVRRHAAAAADALSPITTAAGVVAAATVVAAAASAAAVAAEGTATTVTPSARSSPPPSPLPFDPLGKASKAKKPKAKKAKKAPSDEMGSIPTWLMVTAIFALSYGCIGRGEDIRRLDIADMWVAKAERCTPHDLWVVTFVLRNGKTVHGGVEFTGAGRHIVPECCGPSALMVWLFYSYNVQMRFGSNGQPDFRGKPFWYFDRAFPGGSMDPDRDHLSYATHQKYLKLALRACDFYYCWTTHLGRHAGFGASEDGGADISATKKHSRHDTGGKSAERNYSSSVPAESVAALCGLGTDMDSIFYPADGVHIDEAYERGVFPGAWTVEATIMQQNRERSKDRNDVGGFDQAAIDNCKLMQIGSRWLIQHVAQMQDKFPDHPVFWHPYFRAGPLDYLPDFQFYFGCTRNIPLLKYILWFFGLTHATETDISEHNQAGNTRCSQAFQGGGS